MKNQQGQSLVILLVFMTVVIVLTSAATIITISSSTTTNQLSLGIEARNLAESGIENALIILLRNPDYIGETMSFGEGTVTISVSGEDSKVITSTGSSGDFIRTIRVTGEFVDNTFSITDWEEI